MYSCVAARDKGIKSVMDSGKTTTINDLT
ncbi:hypothetical protein [Shewanella algae]